VFLPFDVSFILEFSADRSPVAVSPPLVNPLTAQHLPQDLARTFVEHVLRAVPAVLIFKPEPVVTVRWKPPVITFLVITIRFRYRFLLYVQSVLDFDH